MHHDHQQKAHSSTHKHTDTNTQTERQTYKETKRDKPRVINDDIFVIARFVLKCYVMLRFCTLLCMLLYAIICKCYVIVCTKTIWYGIGL